MKISITNEEAEIVKECVKKIKYDEADPSRYYDAKLLLGKIKDQEDWQKEVFKCKHKDLEYIGEKKMCQKCNRTNAESWFIKGGSK
jgi:hypothetical protein